MSKLTTAVQDARPLYVRNAMLAAVFAAQRTFAGAVTAEQARGFGPALEPTARRWTALAKRVAALGPDERGRQLVEAGVDSSGTRLWWAHEPAAEVPSTPPPAAPAAAPAARPAEITPPPAQLGHGAEPEPPAAPEPPAPVPLSAAVSLSAAQRVAALLASGA